MIAQMDLLEMESTVLILMNVKKEGSELSWYSSWNISILIFLTFRSLKKEQIFKKIISIMIFKTKK